ncbi:hypothetical protein [Hydrogenovibrio marinus]|nr:hypothetical protein [Hydrogenovibrio marinus]
MMIMVPEPSAITVAAQLAKQRITAWAVNLINKAAGAATGIQMALLKSTQS